MGERDLKMGIAESKEKALLLVGASGGVGTALLKYLSTRVHLRCIPTYNKKLPQADGFSWIQYDSNDFHSAKLILREISLKYDFSVVIDASGAFFASTLQDSSPEDIVDVISTNLTAPLLLAKNAQEFMSQGGKAIFISSIVSGMQIMGSSAYAASKAGLERGILALSPEYSETGQAICGIRLGYMDYGMTYKIKDKIRNEILRGMPQEKFIDISVLGDKILDLLKSEINEINGTLHEIK